MASKAHVVPYVGTWIEMLDTSHQKSVPDVVPYVGTWIEMECPVLVGILQPSFPTWERG